MTSVRTSYVGITTPDFSRYCGVRTCRPKHAIEVLQSGESESYEDSNRSAWDVRLRRTEAKCMEANLSSPRTLRLLFLIDTCMPEEEGFVHASRLSCAPSRRAVHEPSVRPSATSSARRSSSPVHSVEHHEEGRQCVVERVR